MVAGDELIVAVAEMLGRDLRETDTVARLGGDEFAVLLPEAGADDAVVQATEIISRMRDVHISVADDGNPGFVGVTASAGVTEYDRSREQTAEDLLIEADLAMYAAKGAGRSRVELYEAAGDQSRHIAARLGWSRRLRAALDEGQFVLHAQPIRDLATGETVQYELLIRLEEADGRLVFPPVFLYTAERFGLAEEIDAWVTRRAIELLSLAPPGSWSLAVNLTAGTLVSGVLAGQVEDWCDEFGVDPARLAFEITESSALVNVEAAVEFCNRLHELGCTFALDDFGSGYSSFYHLRNLPVDVLKIDGEYVRMINRSQADRVIVDVSVQLAHGLGKTTVAEFVIDGEVEQAVKDLGVDMAQGTFVGPPELAEVRLGIEPAG